MRLNLQEYSMRRIFTLSALCLAAGVLSSCTPDKVIQTENIPTAGVRFINAVPDTAGAGGLDFRFVDIIEDNAQFRIQFRNNPIASGNVVGSSQIEYRNARAGERHFRIFLNDTLQAAASTVLKDSVVTLEAGKLYTVLLWGYARTGATPAMQLKIIEEDVPDPGSQVALRVLNATANPIDVRQYVVGGTAPATATWANVPPLGISTYVTVDTAKIMYNVQPAGGGAALFADVQALPGTPEILEAPGPFDAIPGTTVSGSAVTMIVFPASTAGARTPQSATFVVPAGSFMWDRRPPRGY